MWLVLLLLEMATNRRDRKLRVVDTRRASGDHQKRISSKGVQILSIEEEECCCVVNDRVPPWCDEGRQEVINSTKGGTDIIYQSPPWCDEGRQEVIKFYNFTKGGTDIIDQRMGYYTKSRKWDCVSVTSTDPISYTPNGSRGDLGYILDENKLFRLAHHD